MAERITSPILRFRFVEKVAADVGDGKWFSIKVTADQISEVYYRVKDAEFLSGSLSCDANSSIAEMRVSGIAKTANLVDVITSGDGAFSVRGYCAISNEETPNKPLPNTAVPKFKASYYHVSFPNLTFGTVPLAIRDIGDYETSMFDSGYDPKVYDKIGYLWETDLVDFMNVTGIAAAGGVFPYRNGFTQSFENAAEPALSTLYGIFGEYNSTEGLSMANITIGDEVAFVDLTGSGNPLDPGNELYLSLDFSIYLASDSGAGVLYASTIATDWFGGPMVDSGFRFIMQLSGAVQISCPIYIDEGTDDIIADPSYMLSGADFILAADEWWPSAKNNPAAPVWDTATGAEL